MTTQAVRAVDDASGGIVARLDLARGAEGLAELTARPARIAAPAKLPIAIERLSGLIVDTLIDAGRPVVPIHPNAVKACRPRYGAAGGERDGGYRGVTQVFPDRQQHPDPYGV